MIIKPNHFDNGGEVDITAHYGGSSIASEKGRLSIRRNGHQYEAYVHWHIRKIDEILCRGTLHQCVEFTNAQAGLDDKVEE